MNEKPCRPEKGDEQINLQDLIYGTLWKLYHITLILVNLDLHDGKNLFVNEFTLKSSLIMHLSVVILSVKMICGT